ncbi:nuclear pore complex protein Nup75-like [Drosophila suzukii]|uniref:Nuclear pore complex protein Nup75 n=1 Tax=Drosophila suzukii TaxID=28584 RepID=A0ABM4TXK6_DROSZ
MNRMVAQLMDHDIKLFIYEAQKLNDTHWFSTHLINLIHHCVQLKSYFDQNNIDLPALRHSMIYEYGSYLMTSHNLWQLGIDYLDSLLENWKHALPGHHSQCGWPNVHLAALGFPLEVL